MKHRKTAARIVITAFLCSFLAMPTQADAFTDVSDKHQYADAIKFIESQGIIKGYPDGTFKPDKLVSRAEFLKMVFHHIGYRPLERLYENPYKDVPAGSWFAAYVKKAYDLDLIRFNPLVPLFLPAEPISRIEALKILMPLEGIPTPFITQEQPLLFEDVPSESYFRHIVHAAQDSGVFIAEEQPYFFPHHQLTRAHVAELLYRAQLYRDAQGNGQLLPTINIEDEFGKLTKVESELINNPKFPIFLNVWSKINQEYLHKEKLNRNKLLYGAISGMVNSLEDPYSVFEGPETSNTLQDQLSGNYEGIGTIIDSFEEEFIIIGIISDSPAEKAGLEVGDVITKIDGRLTRGLDAQEIVNSIKGAKGTVVEITVNRDGKTLTFKVTRDKIALESVLLESNSCTAIPETIGYIAIYQFTGSTGSDFEEILAAALAKKPKGLILDLRDNPGGYVKAAYSVLEHFVPAGKTLAEMKVSGKIIDELSQAKTVSNIPIIVLVNDGTASASEIVAGALQDHKLARLVGEQTFGKGTVQEVTVFTDGSLFKLSIAQWLTPNGRNIDHVGLTPDIVARPTKDDVLGKTDSQLQKAIDELTS